MGNTFTFTSEANWETGALTNAVASADGYLEIAEGYSQGEWLSPGLDNGEQGTFWGNVEQSDVVLPGATDVALYYRVAATEGGLAAAQEYGPVDGIDPSNGRGVFSLKTQMARDVCAYARWLQIRLVLSGG